MAKTDILQQCERSESDNSESLLDKICASVDGQRQLFSSKAQIALVALGMSVAQPAYSEVDRSLVHQAVFTSPSELVTGYSDSITGGITPTPEQQAQIDAFQERLNGFYSELVAITESGEDTVLERDFGSRSASDEFLSMNPEQQSAVIDTFYSNGGDVISAITEHAPHLGESRARVDAEVGAAFFELMPRLLRNFEGVPDVIDRTQIDTSITAEEYTERLHFIVQDSGIYSAFVVYLLDMDTDFEYPMISEEQFYALVDAMMQKPDYELDGVRFFSAFSQILREDPSGISSRTGDYIEANVGLGEAAQISPLQFGVLYDATQYAEAAASEAEAAASEAEAARLRSEGLRHALEASNRAVAAGQDALDSTGG